MENALLSAPAVGAQSTTFRETFDGNPNAPERWQPSNWDITVTGNRTEATLVSPMLAHHGPGCEPPLVNTEIPFHPSSNPLVTHRTATNEQTVFLCRGHMMTAVNTSGYAAVYLTPNHMADFSQGESVVQFDMSTLRTSARDWVDFVIMPFEDNQQLNFQDASIPANAIHIEMFNTVGSSRFRAAVYREFERTGLQTRQMAYDSFLTPDPARRDTFEVRISRNHISFGMPAYNMWWLDTAISPALTWDQGIIQLNQRAYNPSKDENCGGPCNPNTWHWDNISIAPAAPFTLSRANRDIAEASNPELTFGQASPANARLRFAGQSSTRVGQGLQISTDGGSSWQDAQLQRDRARIGDEWYKSYWTPIPAGVSSVQFRRADGSRGWRVRDASIWASVFTPGSNSAPATAPETATTPPDSPAKDAGSAAIPEHAWGDAPPEE